MLCRFVLFFLSLGILNSAFGQSSFDSLLEKALEKNAEYSAALKDKESAQAQVSGRNGSYFPTIEAVAGWEDRRVELEPAKGNVGYLRGQFNIFNGFSDQASKNQAKAELLVKEATLEIKKRELRISLREAVSEMLYLHGLYEIFNEEIKVVQLQKQMASKKVAAGLTSSVDNIEFDLRADELEIQKRRIERAHIETHEKLFKIFGEEISDQDISKLQFRDLPEIKSILNKAKIEKNPFTTRANADLAVAEAERITARSELMPRLDFEYAYGRISPSEVKNLKYDESRVGVFLTIPIFSGLSGYYGNKAASLRQAARGLDKTQTARNIQSEFAILKEKVKETIELLEITERKRISSKKYFDMTLAEYRRGIKNSPDLVGATERRFDSEKQKIEFQKDLEILSTQLENLM